MMSGKSSFIEWQLEMKTKALREKINIALMALLMFSATALYTETTTSVYIGITAFCMMFAAVKIFMHIRLLTTIINTKFFLWVTAFLAFIIFDAYLRTQYGEMNFDFIVFSWLSICIFLVLMHDAYRPDALIADFCEACLIAAIAVVVYIVIMERDLIMLGSVRIGDSLSGNVNTVGMHLGLYSLAILFLYMKTKNKLLIPVYIVVAVFMLLTGSKKVFISIGLGLILYELYGGIKFKKILMLLFMLVTLVYAILSNPYIYDIIGSRTIDFLGNIGIYTGTYRYSHSTDIRESLIMTALHCFSSKPLSGWGFNATARFSPYNVYAHNNFVEILANYGLIGFLFYYGMIFSLLFKSLCLPRRNYCRYFFVILILNSLISDMAAVSYTSGVMTYVGPMVVNVCLLKENIFRRAAVGQRRTAKNEQIGDCI